LPGEGNDDASLHYRLPAATADVVASPESSEYDIATIQMVPALVSRAKSMVPEAFLTGLGRPYDEPDVAEAIDRDQTCHIRDTFIPKLLPSVLDGKILELLRNGCKVADLGCGAGIMLISLAQAFPNSNFHGYEVSKVALEKAAANAAKARLSNLYFHDANDKGESLGECDREFDLVIVLDVLHDSTHPADLIAQVKKALKPDGHWLLADIPCKDTIRENIITPEAGAYLGFSTCLCMACALSVEGGAGLGTLGFTIPVAKTMLKEGGFENVEVFYENADKRWFLVH
jgi:2-polyprenyl-3-methyl-5-hydroxy-6-metoxy-1,4-benzoquinol methylase